MSASQREIYPDIINEVVCEGCSRINKIVPKRGARGNFAYTCACGATIPYTVINRREAKRRLSNAFGTCWLDENERGITIKIIDISENGLKIEFMGRKSELAPKIITTGKGKVIYNEAGEIISQPREVVFKNMNGLNVGAEFVEVETEGEAPIDHEEGRSDPTAPRREKVDPKGAGPAEGDESDKKRTVRMKCRACGHEIVETAEYNQPVSIKCAQCGKVFKVQINRRNTSRSNVTFPGRISDLTGEKYDINVENLSDNGICFTLLDQDVDVFNKLEHLIVSFNKADERISGKAIIISFSGDKRIHARFKVYKT